MRVLIIHTAYKLKGGEDSVVANEMELLKSNGVSVELLQFSNEGNTLLKLLQMPFNVFSYRKTRKKIRAYKPDIVHIHNLHFAGSPSVMYAVKKEKVPFVYTLHNYRLLCPSATLFFRGEIFMDSFKQGFPWSAISKGVYQNSKLLTAWVSFTMQLHNWAGTWKLSRRYIVLSEHSRSLFMASPLKTISDRIVIKPNFCYAAPVRTSGKSDFYLYIGRLCEEKGILLLLETFSGSGLPLKIVGSGPLENMVTEYSTRYSNIEFLHALKKEDVYHLMTDCSALIFPSLWYETFGMVIIESFSAGTPVIASRLGPMKDLVTDHYNGLHFEAGNVLDLGEKINFREGLGEEGKAAFRKNARLTYEKNYTPEANLEKLLSIYQSVIEEERTPGRPVPEKLVLLKERKPVLKTSISESRS